jgi:hypothetical protein
MAKKDIKIDESNFYEWLCSTGYLLPKNEIELERFERLFPESQIPVNENAIDPFAIIEATRKPNQTIQIKWGDDSAGQLDQLRMAARKHQALPEYILQKIMKNQTKGNGEADNAKSKDEHP